MSLKDKYAKLLEYAQSSGVQGLSVTEQNNILYVSGSSSSSVKNRIWEIYDQIDPDMRSADLVLKIEEIAGQKEVYVVKSGDNLSKIATKYSGMTANKIFEANKDKIKDPNLIRVGQELIIPL